MSKILMKDLKQGDHIAVRGKLENLHRGLKPLYFITGEFYFHHGIYIGNDEVIDFSGITKADAKPRIVDILTFFASSCDGTLYRVDGDDESPVSEVEEILLRAFEMVKDPSKWPGYNVFWNNCESFAYYLKTGKARTEQGINALESALGTGAAAAVGLALVVGGIAAIAISCSSSSQRENRKR